MRLQVSRLGDGTKEHRTVLGSIALAVHSARWMVLPSEDSMEFGSVL